MTKTKEEKILALTRALKVITLDTRIRAFLQENDPMVLKQAEDALSAEVGPEVLVEQKGDLFFATKAKGRFHERK